MPESECADFLSKTLDLLKEYTKAVDDHSINLHDCKMHDVLLGCTKAANDTKKIIDLEFKLSETLELFKKTCIDDHPRAYLPYGLTEEEKADPALLKKLSSCIEDVENKSCPESAKSEGKIDYSRCSVNPVAVCRASIERSIENLIEK